MEYVIWIEYVSAMFKVYMQDIGFYLLGIITTIISMAAFIEAMFKTTFKVGFKTYINVCFIKNLKSYKNRSGHADAMQRNESLHA